MDLRKLLLKSRVENGITAEIPCSEEASKTYEQILKEGGTLPEGIYKKMTENGVYFYSYSQSDISQDEMNELLLNLQLKSIRTIKSCVVFFTALTVISLIILVFYYLIIFSA